MVGAVHTHLKGNGVYVELTTSTHHSSAIWMHSMCELAPPTLQSAFMRDLSNTKPIIVYSLLLQCLVRKNIGPAMAGETGLAPSALSLEMQAVLAPSSFVA